MADREDRRVQRTRELLRTALFSLIREKGFEELSVQDIVDRANVGRATFYAHFDNKEDLLLSGFETLRTSLKERQREARLWSGPIEEQVLAFSHELFAHVNDHRDLFQHMVGRHSGALVQNVLRRLMLELVREEIKSLLPRAEARLASREVLTEFVAGGMFGVLMWWLVRKTRPSVEELDAMFRQIAVPVLKAAA